AFLKREDLPDDAALALEAVRVRIVGDVRLYVIAGRRLDAAFLTSLVLPPGMRVLLYRNLEPAFSPQALAGVAAPDAEKMAPLIGPGRRHKRGADGELRGR